MPVSRWTHERLVRISAGRLEIDLRRASSQPNVTVTAFDDAGWQTSEVLWNERWAEGKGLADVVREVGAIDQEEAERIVAESLDELRLRGIEDADRKDDRMILGFLAGTFGLAAAGALTAVALATWLLIRVLSARPINPR